MLSHDVACSQPRDERAALLLLREEKAHGETYLSGLYVICAWSCGCAARRRVFRSRAARKAEPYGSVAWLSLGPGRRGAGYGFDLLKSALRNANRGARKRLGRRAAVPLAPSGAAASATRNRPGSLKRIRMYRLNRLQCHKRTTSIYKVWTYRSRYRPHDDSLGHRRRDTHEVDAIAIARRIGKVVLQKADSRHTIVSGRSNYVHATAIRERGPPHPKVRVVDANRLAAGQHAHILPAAVGSARKRQHATGNAKRVVDFIFEPRARAHQIVSASRKDGQPCMVDSLWKSA